MANTTIVVKVGYRNFALPYTDRRAAAIADLMSSATLVGVNFSGELYAMPQDETMAFSVVQQDIPVYVEPTNEPSNDETEN